MKKFKPQPIHSSQAKCVFRRAEPALALGIPGLRTWRVVKFPLLWCYFERGDHLDVVRLLGERRDIAAISSDEFASKCR